MVAAVQNPENFLNGIWFLTLPPWRRPQPNPASPPNTTSTLEPDSEHESPFLAVAEPRPLLVTPPSPLLGQSSRPSLVSAQSGSSYRSMLTIHPGHNEPPRSSPPDGATYGHRHLALDTDAYTPRRRSSSVTSPAPSYRSLSPIDMGWRERTGHGWPASLQNSVSQSLECQSDSVDNERMPLPFSTPITPPESRKSSSKWRGLSILNHLVALICDYINRCLRLFQSRTHSEPYDAV